MLNIFYAFATGSLVLIIVILYFWIDSEKSRKDLGMGYTKGYTQVLNAWWWICLIGEMLIALLFGLIGAVFNFIAICFTGFIETIKFLQSEPQAYDESIPGDKGI